jgi:hypothetical protein
MRQTNEFNYLQTITQFKSRRTSELAFWAAASASAVTSMNLSCDRVEGDATLSAGDVNGVGAPVGVLGIGVEQVLLATSGAGRSTPESATVEGGTSESPTDGVAGLGDDDIPINTDGDLCKLPKNVVAKKKRRSNRYVTLCRRTRQTVRIEIRTIAGSFPYIDLKGTRSRRSSYLHHLSRTRPS